MKLKLIDIKKLRAHQQWAIERETVRRRLSFAAEHAIESIRDKLAELDAAPEAFLPAPDATKINDALDAVNGRASTYTYTSSIALVDIAKAAEDKLDRHGVPQDKRVACTVTAVSGVPTAKSYSKKGSSTAIATRVLLARTSTGWYVAEIKRIERHTGPGGQERIDIKLTDAAREAVIANALADFSA